MANKIECFSPKKEIIDHFDSLINRVDIDIEQSLEKYNQEQVLSNLDCFYIENRNVRGQQNIYLNRFDSNEISEEYIEYETVDEWPESTKVVDYLNRIRMRTIGELRKAQEDTLQYYKLNSSQFKLNSMDEVRSELFKDKFHFQVLYKPEDTKYSEPWIFNLFTFVTDFYLSSTDINLFEKLINFSEYNNFDCELVLDEKMVLIGLLEKHFFINLKTQNFPSHVIIVRKEDLLNFKEIECFDLKGVDLSASKSIDLSNLERLNLFGINETTEIKIEGFYSLKSLSLRFQSLNQVILTNLFALKRVDLNLETPINSDVVLKLIEYLPYIEILQLRGKLSYFNLDSLSNLKGLELSYTITNDFNFDLFDNICNQLESITLSFRKIDDKYLEKLFYGRNFPYLSTFYIVNSLSNIKLEKKLFDVDGLRTLRKLMIIDSNYIQIINNDVFSNLINLEELCLSDTFTEFIDKTLFSNLINLKKLSLCLNRIESIEENCFSNLHNLEYLDLSFNHLRLLSAKSFVGLDNLKELNLSHNKLVNFDLDIFDNIGKFVEIDLCCNLIINKDEILNRSGLSNIKVKLS